MDKDIDTQFLCKDCERYNLCEYYHRRKKDSYICKYFHLSETSKPRWIPVSERLPDTDDEVLCWYEYYHWSQEKVLPEDGFGSYFKETKAWFGEVAIGKDVRVIAWMPLPKPYEPQESETK